MPACQPGEVLLILFPFSDAVGAKKRPALVLLDTGDDDVLVARITAQPRESGFDCELAEWGRAGLKAPSTVRLQKLATLKKQLAERSLGRLASSDWERVCRSFEQIRIGLQPKEPATKQSGP